MRTYPFHCRHAHNLNYDLVLVSAKPCRVALQHFMHGRAMGFVPQYDDLWLCRRHHIALHSHQRLGKALDDSRGSLAEYPEVMRKLWSLDRVSLGLAYSRGY